jgi:hypothetical protein
LAGSGPDVVTEVVGIDQGAELLQDRIHPGLGIRLGIDQLEKVQNPLKICLI